MKPSYFFHPASPPSLPTRSNIYHNDAKEFHTFSGANVLDSKNPPRTDSANSYFPTHSQLRSGNYANQCDGRRRPDTRHLSSLLCHNVCVCFLIQVDYVGSTELRLA